MKKRVFVTIACVCLVCGACADQFDDMPDWFFETVDSQVSDSHPLAHVQTWTYIIQDQWEGDKMDQVVASDYDLVVLDDPSTISDMTDYDTAAEVAKIKASNGGAGKPKLVIAYVDIAEAEDYRYYWQSAWQIGSPAWILAADPDGWSGNYPVAYWDDAWYDIVVENADSLVNTIVANGFDGIYMDWIEAVSFEPVMEAADAEGLDVKAEMALLIENIRDKARETNPDFLVIAQNAVDMRDTPGYLALLDGEAQEQVWFDGEADVFGTDPKQGDCRLPTSEEDPEPEGNADYCSNIDTMSVSSEYYVTALRDFLKAGVPVLTVDYALQAENADFAYAAAAYQGFVGYVSMRSLEDLSATTPWDFELEAGE